MRILDPACGGKMFWFDKENPDVVFGDIRSEEHTLVDGRHFEVRPDAQMSFEALPFCDGSFDMVVFDPPHLENAGDKGWQKIKYGRLEHGWRDYLPRGFSECFRVLKDGGFLIFKWNETQILVSEITSMIGRPPLFGHKSGKAANTHWLCFAKTDRPPF